MSATSTAFKNVSEFAKEQNSSGDSRFIATVTVSPEGQIELEILDSYHQGIGIWLHPDGTYGAFPVGG
jgi:hypothetical protein